MTARFRTASALEILLGASIVIGHNVFRVVPNEVPILFVLGLLSFRLRNGGVSAMGLMRPVSWARTVAVAAAAAGLRSPARGFVLGPPPRRFWPPAVVPAGAEALRRN